MTGGRNRDLYIVVIALAALMLGSFTLSAYSVWHGQRVACERNDVALTILGDLLTDAKLQAIQNTRIDLEQRRAFARFYDTYLDRIQKVRC